MQIKHPNVLSIAGIDPSGGAGLLADVKTISSLGGYATGVVTAATAQNSQGVFGVIPIPTDFVKKQIDVLFEDVRIDSVKIGMLFDSNLIKGVAERLRYWNPHYIVLDPVMVAKSGDALLTDDAVATLRDELLPLATVITPNLPEAARLLETVDITDDEQMEAAANDLWKLKGCHGWVYLKGGHMEGVDYSEDLLYDGRHMIRYRAERTMTKNTHGTGCTLSSAIASGLAKGLSLPDAISAAKEYISGALASMMDLGHGSGPLNHAYRI